MKLFHRSPRQITLTGDGEFFYAACRKSMSGMEVARSLVSGHAQPARGKLRLAVPVSFGQFVVAPALAAWSTAHPDLEVEVVLTDRHVDMTAERFDLSVMLGDVPDSRLVARALPPHRFLTVAAPSYLRKHGVPLLPEDLSGHRCLRYVVAESGQFRTWTYTREGQNYRHVPVGPLASDHATVLLALAEAGHGILQAPRYVVSAGLAAGRLESVLDDHACTGAPLSIVYGHARQASARTRLMVEFLLGLGEGL